MIVQVLLGQRDVLNRHQALARHKLDDPVDPHPAHGRSGVAQAASLRSTKRTTVSTVKISPTLPTCGSCSNAAKSTCGSRAFIAAMPSGVTLPLCTYRGSCATLPGK